jgi:hypothetical protein
LIRERTVELSDTDSSVSTDRPDDTTSDSADEDDVTSCGGKRLKIDADDADETDEPVPTQVSFELHNINYRLIQRRKYGSKVEGTKYSV